ncbi:MAG: sugar ABC transporter substrate-binding protein [Devosia nanyangense]|uniref:Sugar ABC transporter substrate-binding protein n=1 Tax=Devosia nanyangense TaxID=1228055 RepID=A0A933NZM2_9HYPH|nr:sugar ABC transporter substrate-binding protein [Devosia nanyangense]
MRLPKLITVALAALLVAMPLGAVAEDLQMWERSGGNASMVDELVRAWNEANPDRKIVLTYIPHSEMVPKIAQAIASGEVPDLMGMDLIYGPQFEDAGQLEDVTDYFKDDPTLKTASPGHIQVATYKDRLYGVPLYADVSVLFWNKLLFKQAGLDPEVGPASLQDIHDMAAKITALGDGNYGYYLAGNCAGCNIFTFGPLIWASGGTIEPKDAADEPLTGDNLVKVLEWARMMHKEGLINPANQAENGETFHLQFGSGKVGIMGTGNFNLFLLKEQNAALFDGNVGITFLPGLEKGKVASFAGGDIVTIPKGSKHVKDAVDFMKFILSDNVQVESYAKLMNLTTRADMAKNKYFEADPRVQKMAEALDVARTPYTLKFFELINSPQGPWLQMLQRVYYSDDPIDQIIADGKAQMKAIAAE